MYLSKAARARGATWHQATLDLVCELESAKSGDVVIARFQQFAEVAGFASVACVLLPRVGELNGDCVLMNTRPEAWSAEYLRREFARCDPVLREASRTDRPFVWSDISRQRPLTPGEKAVMSYSAEFGMRDGFVVPIFESDNLGLVSFAAASLELKARQQQALTLAAVYLHNRLSALRNKQAKPIVRLTEREHEVVRWIAAGKSDWQIGRILNISAKTVNFHVENVKRKFRVASRMQAVIGAIIQGRHVH
jgi:LuxR family quorum sensing-dependent transcriptional regulator